MTTWKMKVNSGNDTNTLMIQLRLYLLCFKYILGCQFVSLYFCLFFSSNNTFYILHLSNSFTNVIKIRLHVAIFLLYLVVVLGFEPGHHRTVAETDPLCYLVQVAVPHPFVINAFAVPDDATVESLRRSVICSNGAAAPSSA